MCCFLLQRFFPEKNGNIFFAARFFPSFLFQTNPMKRTIIQRLPPKRWRKSKKKIKSEITSRVLANKKMTDAALSKLLLKKNLVDMIGYRISIVLDDRSKLKGRLVSVSAFGNVVLTDAEREFVLKRKRNEGKETSRIRREQYLSVIYVQGSSIVSVSLTRGVTTDPSVVDTISRGSTNAPGVETAALNIIKVANLNPVS